MTTKNSEAYKIGMTVEELLKALELGEDQDLKFPIGKILNLK